MTVLARSTVVRRFGPAMALTLTSQVVSAGSLFALALLGRQISDLYALGVALSTSAYTGIVLQVVYLVALGRPWFSSWRLWTWAAIAFSLANTVVMAWIQEHRLPDAGSALAILGLFGVGGAVLAAAGTRAVRLACLGQPLWMIAVTIVPNLALTVSSAGVFAYGSSDGILGLLPALAWALATPVLWLLVVRTPLPASTLAAVDHEEEREGSQRLHAATLALGVLSSTVLPNLYLSALTQLAAGVTTVILLVTRIGSSIVNLGVGSILAVKYNWLSAPSSFARLASWLTAAASVVGLSALILHATVRVALPSYVALVASWCLAIVAAPLVLREVNARRLVRPLLARTLADVAASVVLLVLFFRHTSVSGYFSTSIIQQTITIVACGIAIRHRALWLSALPLTVIAVVQFVIGW